jgi:hypothetical protein
MKNDNVKMITLENDNIQAFKNDNIYTMKNDNIKMITLENDNIHAFKNDNIYTMKNDFDVLNSLLRN